MPPTMLTFWCTIMMLPTVVLFFSARLGLIAATYQSLASTSVSRALTKPRRRQILLILIGVLMFPLDILAAAILTVTN